MIVDSQVHIWAPDTPDRPWPILDEQESRPQRSEAFTAEELLREMDVAGVSRAILCPPAWEGIRNDVTMAASRAYPERFAVMGRLDVSDPASREAVSTWRSQSGMLGLRYGLHRPKVRSLFLEGCFDWLWGAAENAEIPMMIFPHVDDLPVIDGIAQRHPKLKLILDHLGLSGGGKDDRAFACLNKVLALAACPNVAVKVSCLPAYTNDGYPFRSLHGHLQRTYQAFGARRMFWGSDLSRLPCPYGQCVTLFTKELEWLPKQDLEWVMGRGLCEWLGWKVG